MKIGMRLGISGIAIMAALNVGFTTTAGAQSTESSEIDNGGIADIVVTAQRRSESVQSSSLSISVLSSSALQKVNDAKDIATLVPGVQISAGGSTLQTYVRGIGDFGSSALNQSAVSYNIDGVYAADTAAVSPQFFDLARIEVLKGPQGTLYGRNASAGSVNLVFARPELGMFGGTASLEVGNYALIHGSAAINVPLGDQAALRVSGNYLDRDGYLSDGTNDDVQRAGRIQFLLEPNDDFSLRLSADIAHQGGQGGGSVLIPRQPSNDKFTGSINAQNNGARLAVAPAAYTPGAGLPPVAQTGLRIDTFLDVDQTNLSAEINWRIGPGTLTFIPAFRKSDSSIGSYISGSPFLNQEDNEQKSAELRYAYDADWGDIIIGGYYLDLRQNSSAQVFTATYITANQTADLGTKSKALFGQTTIKLSNAFRLIAGARYTSEDRTIVASDFTNGVNFSNALTFNEWTWRGGVEYDLTPQNMAYVTVSKGFKSGGFNIFAPTPVFTNAYQPEKLYSYAAGLRNRFLDNHIQFNVEGFYWKYKDSQQNALAFTPAFNLQFSTFNAASATLYGFDADLIVKPTRNDTLSGTLAFVDATFDSFLLQTPFPTAPASNGCTLNNAVPPFSIDCSGFRLPRAPRWTGTAAYEHVFDLPGGSEFAINGSMDFASGRSLGINYVSNEQASAYVRFNADATFRLPGNRFSITAFIRNITNEEVPIAGNQAGLSPNLIYAQVAAPRTFGVRLNAGF